MLRKSGRAGRAGAEIWSEENKKANDLQSQMEYFGYFTEIVRLAKGEFVNGPLEQSIAATQSVGLL